MEQIIILEVATWEADMAPIIIMVETAASMSKATVAVVAVMAGVNGPSRAFMPVIILDPMG